MKRLVVAFFMIFAVTLVAADDLAPPRPRLENFANYNEFLAAVYAHKKQIELEKKFADSIVINIQLSEKSDQTSGVSVMPVKSPELNAAIDTYLPPLVISGPEDLEMAIEAAKRFLQSFPLKPLDFAVLGEAAIGNGLKLNFSTDNDQQVADNLAGNSPEKKTKEAVAQGDDMSEASLSVLRKAGTFFGSDISINGAVTTPEISVQYRP